MHAAYCVHHKGCMTAFPTKYCSFMRQESQNEKNSCDFKPESRVLAELIKYIVHFEQKEDVGFKTFKLSELIQLYTNH